LSTTPPFSWPPIETSGGTWAEHKVAAFRSGEANRFEKNGRERTKAKAPLFGATRHLRGMTVRPLLEALSVTHIKTHQGNGENSDLRAQVLPHAREVWSHAPKISTSHTLAGAEPQSQKGPFSTYGGAKPVAAVSALCGRGGLVRGRTGQTPGQVSGARLRRTEPSRLRLNSVGGTIVENRYDRFKPRFRVAIERFSYGGARG